MGCIVLFQVFAPPQCGPIRQTLSQLQANVPSLERALRQTGQGRSNTARSNIMTAMRMINCSLEDNRGLFRTVCVRPTDGYYYPLSYSTTPERFDLDAATLRHGTSANVSHNISCLRQRAPGLSSPSTIIRSSPSRPGS